MPLLTRSLAAGAITLILMAQAGAESAPLGYTCTNMMGGNPFRLTIFPDGNYLVAPHAGTSLPSIMDGGRLEQVEMGKGYIVLSGPLRDELEIATIHVMSPTHLTSPRPARLAC